MIGVRNSGLTHALLFGVSVVAWVIARHIAGPLTPVQLGAIVLALEFLVQPLSTLIHEFGHAAVARRVTPGAVSIIVGRGPYVSFTVNGVRVNFSSATLHAPAQACRRQAWSDLPSEHTP